MTTTKLHPQTELPNSVAEYDIYHQSRQQQLASYQELLALPSCLVALCHDLVDEPARSRRTMKRGLPLVIGVAALLVGAWVAACGPSAGPKTGTQTNWLIGCRSDAECGNLKCLCGACTRSCADLADCSELPGTSCVLAEDRGAIALCAGGTPTSPGLCLPRCPSEGCESGTSCVAQVCTPLLQPTARVSVDASERFQALVGIGAAVAYVDDELAQHPRKQALFDAMFSKTGLSVLRLRNRYADEAADLNATEELVSAATERLGHPPMIILNSASPPDSLKLNGSSWCEGNPDTCTLVKLPAGSFDYAGLASHWRNSLDAYARQGIEPDYISIQNNPNWVPAAGAAIEACRFLPSEGSVELTSNAGSVTVDYPGYAEALDAVTSEIAGLAFVPQLVAPETSGFVEVAEYAAELDFAKVGAIAHHMYGSDPTALDTAALAALGQLAEKHERPLFQSEMQADALTTAVFLHASLVLENAAVFVQNGFVGSANSVEPNNSVLINLTAEDFVIGDPYHVMLHYSSHISPGWARVAADSDTEQVLASAWVSPDDGAMAIVLTNPGLIDQVVTLDTGASVRAASTVIRTVLRGVERSADLGALPADNMLTLPGQSLVTVTLQR